MVTTFQGLMERLCDDGVASVKRRELGSKRIGALRGFELARACQTPEALCQAVEDQQEVQEQAREKYHETKKGFDLSKYWEGRYCTLQLEYCWQVLAVGLGAEVISVRAGVRYAEIVGFKDDHYDHGDKAEGS